MIVHYLSQLGFWNWFLAGLILLMLEIMAPGIFFIWFGLAALITGTLSFLFGAWLGFGWQVETVTFLILSILFVLLARRYFGPQDRAGETLLNQRGEQLIGQRATLAEPITNGRGRLRIDDTMWRVTGPDLDAGTQVRVVAFNPVTLEIEVKADASPS